MAIELTGIVPRSARRIRLVFNNTPSIFAFGAPAPSYYTVTAFDATGTSIAVSAALVVPNSPTNVELALADDLIPGARYTLSAIGVPAIDYSASTGASVQVFAYADKLQQVNVESYYDDDALLLYGRDLVYSNNDFQETPQGDLATVEGVPNVLGAIQRRIESERLPWAPQVGGQIRQYVDSPTAASGDVRTAILGQVLGDDRVKSVTVDVSAGDAEDEIIYIINPVLTGDEQPRELKGLVK